MKKLTFLIYSFIIISFSICSGQSTPQEKGLHAINKNVLQAQLGFLASDWMEGRMAGEKGESISADYIAAMLQLYGVKPGGDLARTVNLTTDNFPAVRSFFQNFIVLKTSPGKEHELRVKSIDGATTETMNFNFNVDFVISPPYQVVEKEAPVVFAGYGFKNEKLKFNDLANLDMKGKFILKISGTPSFANQKLTQSELYDAQRESENFVRKAGAAGIIEFNPDKTTVGYLAGKEFENRSPHENTPRAPAYSNSYSIPEKIKSENFTRINVSVKTANEILRGTGNSIEDYIKKAGVNESYTFSPVNGKSIFLKSTAETSKVLVKNIIGIIEGNNPDEVIVLGAHYDHVGMTDGYIWNGADDNGSGTVGVMTIAKAIMETGQKPEKTIILALWTAEEEGLLGSEYYVGNLTYPLKNLKLNVNFDMISRYISDNQPKKVVMTYTSSCKSFKDITAANMKKFNIDLDVDYQPSADPPGGSDHRTFVAAGIPVMRFKPGHREQYHTPYDEVTTVDWDIMEKIVKVSFANVWELANMEW